MKWTIPCKVVARPQRLLVYFVLFSWHYCTTTKGSQRLTLSSRLWSLCPSLDFSAWACKSPTLCDPGCDTPLDLVAVPELSLYILQQQMHLILTLLQPAAVTYSRGQLKIGWIIKLFYPSIKYTYCALHNAALRVDHHSALSDAQFGQNEISIFCPRTLQAERIFFRYKPSKQAILDKISTYQWWYIIYFQQGHCSN